MDSELEWEETAGCSEAPSAVHDEGSPFWWRVTRRRCGTWWLRYSTPELLTPVSRAREFDSCQEAKTWAEIYEQELVASLDAEEQRGGAEMSRKWLHRWVSASGSEYCLTLDGAAPGCYRVHKCVNDSMGERCWTQRLCSHPQAGFSTPDAEKQALHDTLEALHHLAADGTKEEGER